MFTELIDKLIDFITSPGVILLGSVTLLDIAPIKIDPWKWMFKAIGNVMLGDMRQELTDTKDAVTELKTDFENTRQDLTETKDAITEMKNDVSDTRQDLVVTKDAITEMKSDFEDNKAKEKRWHILDFVNSCRRGEDHSREEWNHAIAELADYEVYCELKHITNGVIEEDAKYLRHLYYERNLRNDFL